MDKRRKTAIILGATGLTGGILLKYLLEDDRYGTIKLFSRSSVGFSHSKIQEHLCDVLHLEEQKAVFKADEVYCCIGTTNAKTPDKELYRKIDFGIPVNASRLCQQNDIKTLIVISAMGANADSSIFYNRTKGQMEATILEVGIENTYILQPSLISGNRNEKRIGEWIFKQLMRVVNIILVGPLKNYRSIQPESIAKTMIWLANNTLSEKRIPSDEIKSIAQRDWNRT